jgi:uncharacterized membrane protein
MSDLYVVAFKDELKAEQVRLDLLSLKSNHLIDVEEAVVIIRTASDKIRMHHSIHFTVSGALGGGFLGMMAGLMLLNPALAVIGGITGTALGAVSGALKELGIDEDFMKKFASHLKPGRSRRFWQWSIRWRRSRYFLNLWMAKAIANIYRSPAAPVATLPC